MYKTLIMYKGSKQDKRARNRLSKEKFYKMKDKKNVQTYNKVTDKHKNRLCSICKVIIEDSKGEKQAPCIKDCCEDCGFGSYCYDCCLTIMIKGDVFSGGDRYDQKYVEDTKDTSETSVKCVRTCGISMMRQLIDDNYGGIHSCLSEETLQKIKENNKNELKYKVRNDSLSGIIVDYL